MRLEEAWRILELEEGATPDDAKRSYKRLALRYHPDKNPSSTAKEKFQSIQDAFTRIQEAEERGRFFDDDDDDGYEDYYDDEYYDDDAMRGLFEQMLFGRMGGFAGFGGFGGSAQCKPAGPFRSEGPCDCPDCVFERQQRVAARKDDELRRAYQARQNRAYEAKRQEQAAERKKNQETFRSAQERARKEAESTRSRPSSKAEQLRQRGNKAFRDGAYARAAAQYTAALKELGSDQPDATILSNRSIAYAKLERYDAALDDADAAIALRGAWDKAHARRAVALEGLGRHDQAAAAFDDAARCSSVPAEEAAYRERAAAMREAHEAQEREAAAKRAEKAEADTRRRADAARREAEEAARRAEVVAELEEAMQSADDDVVERCIAAAQRVGAGKDTIKAAKAELRRRAKVRAEEEKVARGLEEAHAAAGALLALLDASDPPTRSALKTAIKKAEAVDIESKLGEKDGAMLLQRARERQMQIANAAKSAATGKDSTKASELGGGPSSSPTGSALERKTPPASASTDTKAHSGEAASVATDVSSGVDDAEHERRETEEAIRLVQEQIAAEAARAERAAEAAAKAERDKAAAEQAAVAAARKREAAATRAAAQERERREAADRARAQEAQAAAEAVARAGRVPRADLVHRIAEEAPSEQHFGREAGAGHLWAHANAASPAKANDAVATRAVGAMSGWGWDETGAGINRVNPTQQGGTDGVTPHWKRQLFESTLPSVGPRTPSQPTWGASVQPSVGHSPIKAYATPPAASFGVPDYSARHTTWRQYSTADGQPYFHNSWSGETAWSLPPGAAPEANSGSNAAQGAPLHTAPAQVEESGVAQMLASLMPTLMQSKADHTSVPRVGNGILPRGGASSTNVTPWSFHPAPNESRIWQ